MTSKSLFNLSVWDECRAWGEPASYICNAMIALDEVHLGARDGLRWLEGNTKLILVWKGRQAKARLHR